MRNIEPHREFRSDERTINEVMTTTNLEVMTELRMKLCQNCKLSDNYKLRSDGRIKNEDVMMEL
jgi:hypothetical protein